MDRPGPRQLLQDVEAGRVDVIVVYKADRLTCSLADFARIVDILDKAGTSFRIQFGIRILALRERGGFWPLARAPKESQPIAFRIRTHATR
jgi:DNA invertase Pin-like site-specific DNA recombinase